MLFKWEAYILNKLYETNLFQKIILPFTSTQDVDYQIPVNIYQHHFSHLHPQKYQLVQKIAAIARSISTNKSIQKQRQQILTLNNILQQQQKQQRKKYNIIDVIIFSGLSKCPIWPSMLKTSFKIVPQLIDFYNNFFNTFTDCLEYKFDPLFLSPKFNKLVKQIKEKKLMHPKLFKYIQDNQIEQIQKILKQQNGLNIINKCQQNGLHVTHIAVMKSSMQMINFLFINKANFQLLDHQEQTPLFYAIKRQDLNIIKFLIQTVKVNINHTEYQNRTPFYLAAFQGKLQIVKYLYQHGANPQIQSKLSRTPLSKACYLDNVEVVKYLINLKVKIDSVDSKGRTALHNAAWGRAGGRQGKRRGHILLEDSPQSVQLLIKAGHKIDFQDFDKFTPLFSAVSSHAQRSLRLLVKYGANLKHKTSKNESIVFIACKYGHLAILKILIEQYKCQYQQCNFQGYSPLSAAFTQQKNECSFYLLNLYKQNKQNFGLDINFLNCLLQYKKWQNINFLQIWIDQCIQNKKYIAKQIEDNMQLLFNLLDKLQQKQRNVFLSLINGVLSQIDNNKKEIVLDYLMKQSTYNSKIVNSIIKLYRQGYKINNIKIQENIQQNIFIQLLKINTNLISTKEHLYFTFIKILEFRLTKVIIFILQQCRGVQSTQGISKYKHSQIINLLNQHIDGKLSIQSYILIHGLYDIQKLLSKSYNQQLHLMRPKQHIPNYQYSIQKMAITSFIQPIQVINIIKYEYLSNLVSQQFHQKYQFIKQYQQLPKFTIHTITSVQDIYILQQSINSSHLIGIDVQHFSNSQQSFVCLIQIAIQSKVFIIDRFAKIYTQIQNTLSQLFQNKNKIKIFHSYDNDLKWLVQDYLITNFHAILDTSRIYSLSNKNKHNSPSLKTLSHKYLNIQMGKQFQKSDWRIRPLLSQMQSYAAIDAYVLPFLLISLVQDIGNNHSKQLLSQLMLRKVIKHSGIRNIIK